MKKRLSFTREASGKWFIKLNWWPAVLKPFLEMVAGADVLLEKYFVESGSISGQDGCFELEFEVCTTSRENFPHDDILYRNILFNKDMKLLSWKDGRIYTLFHTDIVAFSKKQQQDEEPALGNNVWLCFVTWLVFWFRYPEIIYFRKLK